MKDYPSEESKKSDKRVLWIENDHRRIRAILTEFEFRERFEIIVVPDPAQAREELNIGQFNLIILDFLLNDDYYACANLIQEIREHTTLKNIPIVVFTAGIETAKKYVSISNNVYLESKLSFDTAYDIANYFESFLIHD